MIYLQREVIVNDLMHSFKPLMENHQLEDIAVFEEEGEGDTYYMGYSVRKNDSVYMIHRPFKKNEKDELTPVSNEWIIESDAGDNIEARGFENLDEVFEQINNGLS